MILLYDFFWPVLYETIFVSNIVMQVMYRQLEKENRELKNFNNALYYFNNKTEFDDLESQLNNMGIVLEDEETEGEGDA